MSTWEEVAKEYGYGRPTHIMEGPRKAFEEIANLRNRVGKLRDALQFIVGHEEEQLVNYGAAVAISLDNQLAKERS